MYLIDIPSSNPQCNPKKRELLSTVPQPPVEATHMAKADHRQPARERKVFYSKSEPGRMLINEESVSIAALLPFLLYSLS